VQYAATRAALAGRPSRWKDSLSDDYRDAFGIERDVPPPSDFNATWADYLRRKAGVEAEQAALAAHRARLQAAGPTDPAGGPDDTTPDTGD
jgi:hypothetical protein